MSAAVPRLIELELVKKWDGKAPQSVATSQGGANILLPLTKGCLQAHGHCMAAPT